VSRSTLFRAKGWGQTMIHRIPATPAPGLARTSPWLSKFICGRSWCGLALACLLLAGCAGAGASPSPLASEETSPPKADPAAALAAAAGSAAASTGAVAADPALLQRRRHDIAEMLEGNLVFRGILDDGAPKLTEAKLAGPFEYTYRSLFSSKTPTRTLYCASADVSVSFFPPVRRTALIRVQKTSGGPERLRATGDLKYAPFECRDAKYGPFPEIEQLRAQRRKALGKTD
jgi:hypothetical protein